MKFTEVEPMMKDGAKIKLAKWKNAYWYMDEKGCIINHFEEGEEVPAIALFPNDLIWVMRDDWEVVQEPKEEKTYPFGYAISELKNGKRVARKGWNGKNQYIELASCISYKNAAGEIVNVEHKNIGNKAISFVGTSGVQMGWLASQADMLADDWYVVE